jgi:2-polyprenyl-3-methyl-5-hydroxy-6-metoxy-1,4-benzoquinol methylase
VTQRTAVRCAGCGRETATHVLTKAGEVSLWRCARCDLGFAGEWADLVADNDYRYYAERLDWPAERIHTAVNTARLRQLLDDLAALAPSRRLLDVGCGLGELVKVAVDNNWDARGVELSTEAVAVCTRFDLPCDSTDFLGPGLDGERYGVVTMVELVEHVADPRAFLVRAAELLEPGGGVYLTTPNFGALGRRLLGADWPAVGREHVNYFTPATLAALIETTPLDVVRLRTKNLSPSHVRMFVHRLRRRTTTETDTDVPNEFAGSPTAAPDYQLRERIEGSRALRLAKATVNRAVAATGTGETIEAVLQVRAPEAPR